MGGDGGSCGEHGRGGGRLQSLQRQQTRSEQSKNPPRPCTPVLSAASCLASKLLPAMAYLPCQPRGHDLVSLCVPAAGFVCESCADTFVMFLARNWVACFWRAIGWHVVTDGTAVQSQHCGEIEKRSCMAHNAGFGTCLNACACMPVLLCHRDLFFTSHAAQLPMCV